MDGKKRKHKNKSEKFVVLMKTKKSWGSTLEPLAFCFKAAVVGRFMAGQGSMRLAEKFEGVGWQSVSLGFLVLLSW